MAVTHAIIAAAGTSLFMGSANPIVLGLAIVGSQLPDLDTSTSLIGQVFFPISTWIEERYPHRSVTHSFLATVTIALCSSLLYWKIGWSFLALPLGHLLACFSDAFTKQGVQLFWPDPAWAVSVSNPNRRFTTGGTGEYWVLTAATALLILGVWLAYNGGVSNQVSQQLGLKNSVIDIYNQNANEKNVLADIQGVFTSDRSDASGIYWIIATEDSNFIVTNGKDLFKTGDQIITKKITTKITTNASTQVVTLNFDDEEVIPKLKKLMADYPGAAIFLSGELGVDFPDEIKIQVLPNQLPTMSVFSSTVKLNYQPVEQTLIQLNDQYAIGNLTAKIITPKPEGF